MNQEITIRNRHNITIIIRMYDIHYCKYLLIWYYQMTESEEKEWVEV